MGHFRWIFARLILTYRDLWSQFFHCNLWKPQWFQFFCSEASEEKQYLRRIEVRVGSLSEKQAQLSAQLTKVGFPLDFSWLVFWPCFLWDCVFGVIIVMRRPNQRHEVILWCRAQPCWFALVQSRVKCIHPLPLPPLLRGTRGIPVHIGRSLCTASSESRLVSFKMSISQRFSPNSKKEVPHLDHPPSRTWKHRSEDPNNFLLLWNGSVLYPVKKIQQKKICTARKLDLRHNRNCCMTRDQACTWFMVLRHAWYLHGDKTLTPRG